MNELVPLNTILSEIDAIEQEVGTPAYWKDEAKQQRYRSLLARKAQYSAGQPTLLSEGIHIFGPDEYAREHGTTQGYDHYLSVIRECSDVLFGVPDDEQAEFVQSFEGLPDGVVEAALGELMGKKFNAGYSDAEAVADFSRLPEGAILVREWGADGQRNHALVRERLWRVVEACETDRDAEIFLDWHARLSIGAKVALYRKLSA